MVGACASVRRIDRLRSDCASKEGGVIAPWRPARVGPESVVRGSSGPYVERSAIRGIGLASHSRECTPCHVRLYQISQNAFDPSLAAMEKCHLTFSRLGTEPTPRPMGECWLDPSSTAGTGCVQLWAFTRSDLYDSMVLSSTPVHRRLDSAWGVWRTVFGRWRKGTCPLDRPEMAELGSDMRMQRSFPRVARGRGWPERQSESWSFRSVPTKRGGEVGGSRDRRGGYPLGGVGGWGTLVAPRTADGLRGRVGPPLPRTRFRHKMVKGRVTLPPSQK